MSPRAQWPAAWLAALLYGGWAAWANHEGGLMDMLMAAATQGLASLVATAFGLRLLAGLVQRAWLPALCAPLLVVGLLSLATALAQWLSGAPHPLLSVAPSFFIGWLYFSLWLHWTRTSPRTVERIGR